jgi:hypothetical protein
MRMSPAQSLETWQDAVNPAPEVAGLHDILGRLLALPSDVVTAPLRDRWARLLGELPPLPVGEVDGVRLLLPASEYSLNKNTENPELYAVFPFRLFGVGRPDLGLARATYAARTHRHNYGWCQDSIQAACLGLAEESARLVVERVDEANAPSFDASPRNDIFTEAQQLRRAGAYRFPAMWGPNYDWIPDQDHGNNLLTTLQHMLVQWADDRIYLLPAWPRQWDVRFKLRAPGNTTVTCEVRAGTVVALGVTPPERAKDVVVCAPTPEPQ